MKNRIVLFVFLLFGIKSLSAQKNTWTIGLYSGVQGQIITSVYQEYFGTFFDETIVDSWNLPAVRIKHTFSPIPLVDLTVKYNIKNRFSISTGVGYRSYYLKAGYRDYYNYTTRDDFIQVPIIFQYDIPLKKKGFLLLVQGGIGFGFEVYDKSWGYSPNRCSDYGTDKIYNVETFTEPYWNGGDFYYLLHSGIGFSYRFNSGIEISLLGKYNISSSYISTHSYHTTVKEADTGIIKGEMKEQLYGKGECWNVLLGVTYTFKKKEKITNYE